MFPAYHACLACRGCLACLDWNIRLTHRRHSACLPAFLKLLRVVDGVCLVRFGPVRFGSVRFGSVRFGSVRFGSVRFFPCHVGPSFSVLFRFVWLLSFTVRFVSVCSVCCFVGSFCFVSFHFDSFRFVVSLPRCSRVFPFRFFSFWGRSRYGRSPLRAQGQVAPGTGVARGRGGHLKAQHHQERGRQGMPKSQPVCIGAKQLGEFARCLLLLILLLHVPFPRLTVFISVLMFFVGYSALVFGQEHYSLETRKLE